MGIISMEQFLSVDVLHTRAVNNFKTNRVQNEHNIVTCKQVSWLKKPQTSAFERLPNTLPMESITMLSMTTRV